VLRRQVSGLGGAHRVRHRRLHRTRRRGEGGVQQGRVRLGPRGLGSGRARLGATRVPPPAQRPHRR
jgi:hypothetical protein